MILFELFKSHKTKLPDQSLKTDLHSHLIPGIDDGSQSLDTSLAMLNAFGDLGFKKVITTPHIMRDYYPNTREGILDGLQNLRVHMENNDIDMEIEASAEYYLDEFVFEQSKDPGTLLPIKDKFILFEMSFMDECPFLKEFIFNLKTKGFVPILAHAERYVYYFNKLDLIEDLIERGVLIQLNSISLSGYYSPKVKQQAEELIKKKLVHFMGSDCHNINQLKVLSEVQHLKSYQKALNLPLQNHIL